MGDFNGGCFVDENGDPLEIIDSNSTWGSMLNLPFGYD